MACCAQSGWNPTACWKDDCFQCLIDSKARPQTTHVAGKTETTMYKSIPPEADIRKISVVLQSSPCPHRSCICARCQDGWYNKAPRCATTKAPCAMKKGNVGTHQELESRSPAQVVKTLPNELCSKSGTLCQHHSTGALKTRSLLGHSQCWQNLKRGETMQTHQGPRFRNKPRRRRDVATHCSARVTWKDGAN